MKLLRGCAVWLALLVPFLSLAQENDHILSGAFYIKLKDRAEIPASNTRSQKTQLNIYQAKWIKEFYPLKKSSSSSRTTAHSVLNGLFKVYVNPSLKIDSLIQIVRSFDNVLYAEPIYRERLLYIPNDPAISDGNQPYLDQIKAFDAWNLSRSSSETVIGIIDTGLDFNHEDIQNKIYINENEIRGNGMDDDGNGYIDDYQGYDFADNDTIPQSDGDIHGNRVGGISGAETNNGIGIAGVGFNALISPLKIFTSESNTSFGAYEAILYAADNGYDIVNLSWGSTESFNQANQDIINYAVLEKDVVIVAAAGNSSADEKFYPASYENVLSVGASNLSNDAKAPFSTYNYSIDLIAPGNAIYSTSSTNNYSSDIGTSYAAPLVSGTAALLKTHYPVLSALQLMEIIRVTTDPIYDIPENESFTDKLGSGRLNAYKALSADQLKSIRVSTFEFSSSVGPYLFYGDTIHLQFSITNFLNPIENGTILISSPSEYIDVIDDEISLGELDSLEMAGPFEVKLYLRENTPPDTLLPVKLDYLDEGYKDFQYLELRTTPDHLTFSNNNVSLGLSGDGNLGNFFGSGKSGAELTWSQQSIASQIGFFVGDSTHYVADNLSSSTALNDFSTQKNIKLKNTLPSDHFAASTFADTSKFLIDQRIITNENENFLILEYRITNNSSDTIKKASSGLYFDWSIDDFTQNKAAVDPDLEMLLAYNEASSIYVGLRPYFNFPKSFQSLDMDDLNGNIQDFQNISDSILYQLSDQAETYDSAGSTGPGNDIASLAAHRDLHIPPFGSKRLAFMLAVSSERTLLSTELNKADSLYQAILNNPELQETFISCEGAALALDPAEGKNYLFYTDPLGQNLLTENDTLFTGPIHSDTSFFLINTDSSYTSEVKRLDIRLVDKVADFTFSPDTLFLDDPSINPVSFEDLSFRPVSWQWDFANGVSSITQNPTVNYSSTGTYEISLEVENDLGCTGSATKNLLVAERPPKPEFSLNPFCPGEEVQLTSTNADSIAIYANNSETQPLLTGTTVTLGSFKKDSCVYVSNITGPFESLPEKICIDVSEIEAAFKYIPDTTTSTINVLLMNTSVGSSSLSWYVNSNLVSNENQYSFEAIETSYPIRLAITNSLGCEDSLARTIRFSTTPEPIIEPLIICRNEEVVIEPENGSFFGFYADPDLDSLIHKGTTLSLGMVTDSLSLYVVGLDSILPSSPVQLEISPENIPLKIFAEPDTLILSEQKTAQFLADFENPKQLTWYYNNTVETVPSPVFFFEAAGVYSLVAEAESQRGCRYYDTLSYQVFKEPITTQVLAISEEKAFGVFPNPVKSSLLIQTPIIRQITGIKLLDLQGRVLLKLPVPNDKKELLFDLSGITPGIYMLSIETKKRVTHIKILKE